MTARRPTASQVALLDAIGEGRVTQPGTAYRLGAATRPPGRNVHAATAAVIAHGWATVTPGPARTVALTAAGRAALADALAVRRFNALPATTRREVLVTSGRGRRPAVKCWPCARVEGGEAPAEPALVWESPTPGMPAVREAALRQARHAMLHLDTTPA